MDTSIDFESAQYVRDVNTNELCAIRAVINGTRWSVPLDPANTTYAEIMRQVEAGELTIQEATQEVGGV